MRKCFLNFWLIILLGLGFDQFAAAQIVTGQSKVSFSIKPMVGAFGVGIQVVVRGS